MSEGLVLENVSDDAFRLFLSTGTTIIVPPRAKFDLTSFTKLLGEKETQKVREHQKAGKIVLHKGRLCEVTGVFLGSPWRLVLGEQALVVSEEVLLREILVALKREDSITWGSSEVRIQPKTKHEWLKHFARGLDVFVVSSRLYLSFIEEILSIIREVKKAHQEDATGRYYLLANEVEIGWLLEDLANFHNRLVDPKRGIHEHRKGDTNTDAPAEPQRPEGQALLCAPPDQKKMA